MLLVSSWCSFVIVLVAVLVVYWLWLAHCYDGSFVVLVLLYWLFRCDLGLVVVAVLRWCLSCCGVDHIGMLLLLWVWFLHGAELDVGLVSAWY